MGLKFGDAVRLSWTNIAQHKGRSAVIVLTMAVLFGAVMGFVVLMEGLKQTLVEASVQETDGKLYVLVSEDNSGTGYNDMIRTPEEVDGVDLTPVIGESKQVRIEKKLSEYGGEMVGYVWRYGLVDFEYNVIDEGLAKKFIKEEMEDVPEGEMPILVTKGWSWDEALLNADGELREKLKQRVEDTTYKVGELPGTQDGTLSLGGANPLNIILDMVSMGRYSGIYLIDDGTGRVEEYVREQIKIYLSEAAELGDGTVMLPGGDISPVKMMVARFDDPEKADEYSTQMETIMGIFKVSSDVKAKDRAYDLWGNTMSIMGAFETWDSLLSMLEVILIIVAVVVATFTLAHVIDQDAATIALYRSMGASTNNIYAIYFLYVLELCGLAVLTCLGMTVIFVGLVWMLSGGALAVRLQEFYMLSSRPKVWLFGVNGMFWKIIIMVMVVAPLAIGLSSRRFTPQHIAKKLKED